MRRRVQEIGAKIVNAGKLGVGAVRRGFVWFWATLDGLSAQEGLGYECGERQEELGYGCCTCEEWAGGRRAAVSSQLQPAAAATTSSTSIVLCRSRKRMVAPSDRHGREGMRRALARERTRVLERPAREPRWVLSRATVLVLVQQLTVTAEEHWTTVYHDTFTSEEMVAPAGAIVRPLNCGVPTTQICSSSCYTEKMFSRLMVVVCSPRVRMQRWGAWCVARTGRSPRHAQHCSRVAVSRV